MLRLKIIQIVIFIFNTVRGCSIRIPICSVSIQSRTTLPSVASAFKTCRECLMRLQDMAGVALSYYVGA
jgi:hypothetical protein